MATPTLYQHQYRVDSRKGNATIAITHPCPEEGHNLNLKSNFLQHPLTQLVSSAWEQKREGITQNP
eukprot:scaffold63545_cov58-Attheya_sp.AAC.5